MVSGDSDAVSIVSDSQPDTLRNGTPPDFEALAQRCAADLTQADREDLAEALRLPVEALGALPLLGRHVDGLNEFSWTFPECDGRGRIIGIGRRFRNGDKKSVYQSKRGLTIPDGWQDRPGPVLMPEGPSDTIAATAAGLPAIGRPSNRGGIDHLAELLRGVPADRKLIVIGENDCKKDGTFPGRDGAAATAAELSARLGRPVYWSMTPDGEKDVRAWLDERLAETPALEWAEAGQRLLDKLTRGAKLPGEGPGDSSKPAWVPAPMSAADMAARDWRTTWRVKRVLVTEEPGIIFGPSKILKTSTLMDMCVALAMGDAAAEQLPAAGRFLGEFEVEAPARVLFISGESGGAALWRIAVRICEARGVKLADLGDRLHVECSVPPLWRVETRLILGDLIRSLRAELVIVDPVYLTLADEPESAKNLFAMGAQLGPLDSTCRGAGAQLLLCHHTNSNLRIGETPELKHIAYAGFQQFARQWIGLNRLEEYEHDGKHELVMVAGGSAGHGGRWHVAIDEGALEDDFGGRRWDVTVTAAANHKQQKRREREKEKEAAKTDQQREDEAAVLRAIGSLQQLHGVASKRRLRNACGISPQRVEAATQRLLIERILIEETAVSPGGNGAKQPATTYRRADDSGGEK